MVVKHIVELFSLDGRDFITEVYLNLLMREPDEHGLMYYMGRLAQGHSKSAVIAQLAKSPECRPHTEVNGLKKIIFDELHSTHWFWGFWGRRNKFDKKLLENITSLVLIEDHILNKLVNLVDSLARTSQNDNHQTTQMQSVGADNISLASYEALVKKVNKVVNSGNTEETVTLDRIPMLLEQLPFGDDFFYAYFAKVEL